MEPDAFRYDAFISYRHTHPDCDWAVWLHEALERYRTPRRLVLEKGLRPRLTRVFRDEAELEATPSLAAEIDRELAASRWLIVVCSRNTPASPWIALEVERFEALGRGDRILALLIDGEPAEALPAALCDRPVLALVPGAAAAPEGSIDHFAVDARPTEGKRSTAVRRDALLRILTPLLGCRFDDLRQRDQERRRRRRRATAALSLIFLAVLGMIVYLALDRHREAQRERRVRLVGELEEHATAARRSGDHTLALLLAIASYQIDTTHGLGQRAVVDRTLRTAVGADCFSEALPPQDLDHAAVGPDGRRVFGGTADGRILTCDLEERPRSWTVLWEQPYAVTALDLRGSDLFFGTERGDVWWVPVDAPEEAQRIARIEEGVAALAARPPGGRIAIGDRRGGLHFVDPERAAEPIRRDLHDDQIRALAYSPTGRLLVSGAGSSRATRGEVGVLWRMDDSTDYRIEQVRLEGEAVDAVAVLGEGRFAVVSHVELMELAEGKPVARLRIYQRGKLESPQVEIPFKLPLRAVIPLARGKALAVAGAGGIHLLGTQGEPTARTVLDAAERVVSVVAADPGSRVLLSVSESSDAVRVWDLRFAGLRSRAVSPSETPITGVAFAGLGDKAVVIGSMMSGALVVWDLECPWIETRETVVAEGFARQVAASAGVPDRFVVGHTPKLFGDGDMDHRVQIWELDQLGREPLAVFVEHRAAVQDVALDASGRFALSAGGIDRTARLWDVEGLRHPRTIPVDSSVLSVALGGRAPTTRFAIGCEDGSLRCGTLADEAIYAIPGMGAVVDVALSSDGKHLAAARVDHGLTLYDAKSRTVIAERALSATHVAFAPDGATVAAGDDEGRIWFVATESFAATALTVGTDTGADVTALAYDRRGSRVVTGHADGWVRVLPTTGTLLETAHRLVDRTLTEEEARRHLGDERPQITRHVKPIASAR